MWRHIAESVAGPSHTKSGNPCQDNCRVLQLREGPDTILLACIADGAGSARFGDQGSKLVCDTVCSLAEEYLTRENSFDGLGVEEVQKWLSTAQERLRTAAYATDCEVREFATTLCTAIIAPTRSLFFQVGDGAIILRKHGIYGVVFWPQSGEYANSTNFLTAEDAIEHLDFLAIDARYTSLALMTDGLERLALTFETQTPHPPFFRPFFDALATADEPSGLGEQLGRFLQSSPVIARSDDDKTLVLASYAPDDSSNTD